MGEGRHALRPFKKRPPLLPWEKDRARFALTSPRIKLRLQLLREALNAAGIVAEVVFADAGC